MALIVSRPWVRLAAVALAVDLGYAILRPAAAAIFATSAIGGWAALWLRRAQPVDVVTVLVILFLLLLWFGSAVEAPNVMN